MGVRDIAAKVLAVLEPPAKKDRKLGLLVTDSAYYNLAGVIFEMREQKADRVQIRTLERVQKQIAQVLKICEKQPTR
jgi:hypothetical protein